MNGYVNNLSLKDLLKPPDFKRENYSAHLYRPYSIKLHRQVNLYTHDCYNLWVRLEADPNITAFNERVPAIPIALENGRAIDSSPNFISVKADDTVVIHTVISTIQDDISDTKLAEVNAWSNFCQQRGFEHQEWTAESLAKNTIELANLKKLLRFTSVAGLEINYQLETLILSELSSVRKIIYAKIIGQFPQSDPEQVKASLSRLIVNRQVYTDLHLFPLSMLTEVSAYHEFPQS